MGCVDMTVVVGGVSTGIGFVAVTGSGSWGPDIVVTGGSGPDDCGGIVDEFASEVGGSESSVAARLPFCERSSIG